MQMDWENPDMVKMYKEIFFPCASEKMDNLRRANIKFSHYTSAENALNIISGKSVWLRNTNVMNDFSEVQHGHECIRAAWDDPSVGGRLKSALNSVWAGTFDKIWETFQESDSLRGLDSYMISISEHGNSDNREELYGRLSMWRAYGGSTNVAFVFNNSPFINESDALNAYTSPVLYADIETFKPQFLRVVEGVEKYKHILSYVDREAVIHSFVSALHFAALSTKHPGFWEEREWRVIYTPKFSLTGKFSDKIKSSIRCVSGVPQRIYTLNLENYPDEGHIGATLPELLEEVIIGPTAYPWPIYDAIVEELNRAGVPNAEKKVRVSAIPLRR
ncbi:DUF2971 domain-containing protein [Frigidibacter sp.]|uniref:DUF2971 domain-containing protein n=1 Tax=Frigidibacter sp. TaxID=2586418 RepID=UPI0027367690|nr:DUF2971 domain-containing protein [Frigidibacter sp.]MDP3341495.1 DUF2971 domain-containing protein [Frigidibacter sp.]